MKTTIEIALEAKEELVARGYISEDFNITSVTKAIAFGSMFTLYVPVNSELAIDKIFRSSLESLVEWISEKHPDFIDFVMKYRLRREILRQSFLDCKPRWGDREFPPLELRWRWWAPEKFKRFFSDAMREFETENILCREFKNDYLRYADIVSRMDSEGGAFYGESYRFFFYLSIIRNYSPELLTNKALNTIMRQQEFRVQWQPWMNGAPFRKWRMELIWKFEDEIHLLDSSEEFFEEALKSKGRILNGALIKRYDEVHTFKYPQP